MRILNAGVGQAPLIFLSWTESVKYDETLTMTKKRSFLSATLPLFIISLSGCSTVERSTAKINFSQLEELPSSPFSELSIKDGLGRAIHYYISHRSGKKLPLILFIAGSGCESNFGKLADGKITGGYQNVLLEVVGERAHVMVVEKPGVQLFARTDRPGTAEKCTEEFKKEHTLERWALALDSALNSAIRLPQVNSNKIMVVGHSEGAVMAPHLASIDPAITHTVAIAGSGASQLFDFIVNKNNEEQEEVFRVLDAIKKNPRDIETMYWGHPARRWTSYMKHANADALAHTKAQIYLFQGTLDVSVPVQSFDFLVADLKRKEVPFSYERIEGASHNLNLPSDGKAAGMRRAFQKILDWFALQ